MDGVDGGEGVKTELRRTGHVPLWQTPGVHPVNHSFSVVNYLFRVVNHLFKEANHLFHQLCGGVSAHYLTNGGEFFIHHTLQVFE